MRLETSDITFKTRLNTGRTQKPQKKKAFEQSRYSDGICSLTAYMHGDAELGLNGGLVFQIN